MKNQRKFALFMAMIMVFGLLVACTTKADPAPSYVPSTPASSAPNEKASVKVATLSGPTGMGMAKLMEDNEKGTSKNDYTFSVATAPDEIVAKVVSGEVDIAAVPANLAATLYAKTQGNVQIVALNTLGMLYLVEKKTEKAEDAVQSLSDLEGKTIVSAGQGSTPEFVLNYILEKNDLADKVKVEYVSEHSEVVSMLATGKAEVGLLPEPFATMAENKADTGRVISLATEWEKLLEKDNKSGVIAMGSVIVRKDFAADNKTAVANFMDEYKASINYANTDVADAAKLIVKHGIFADQALAEKALPYCMIVYVDGITMKESLATFLDVLYEANPASVGGALPEDDFYYAK